MTRDSSSPASPAAGAASARPASIAEAIAARDLNNLYLTSCYFADPVKYNAFCALYALMRVIDDRIDELPLGPALGDAARRREHEVVDAWRRALFLALDGRTDLAEPAAACDMAEAELLVTAAADAMRRFPFPRELWRSFFAAMSRDIDEPRFATWEEFLVYTEGASVAPTTIYLYLIASRADGGSGVYRPPAGFDLLTCGRHLGLSSYLAHILRDLAKDLATGERGLLYLAREDLDRHGLTEPMLRRDLADGRARPRVRRLVAEIADRARRASAHGARLLAALDGRLDPDCAFILELIREIYDRILDKLEAVGFDPFARRHQLTLEEKKSAALAVAGRLGFRLDAARSRPFSPG